MTTRTLIWRLDGRLDEVEACDTSPEEAVIAIRDHNELDLIRALARLPEQEEQDDELELDRPEFHRHSVAALRVAPFKLYR